MGESTIALIITSAGIFAVFAGLFIWGLVTRQFRNVEEPKYRIFEMNTGKTRDGKDAEDGDGNKGEDADA